MEKLRYLTLRQAPELAPGAAGWFSGKWGVDKSAYLECMEDCLSGRTGYDWYLCLDGGEIVGGLGVIENDFHDRPDLAPNVCAVYVEPSHRGRGIAGRLLETAVRDMKEKGVSPLYLVTDLEGFYERCGWEYLCLVRETGTDKMTRMYVRR